MRLWILTLVSILRMWGQPQSSTTQTYTFDANGTRQLATAESATTGSREQGVRNLNGSVSPIERVEERVLRDDASGKVTERTIRPYDANGQPGPPHKIRTEERKRPDGSKFTETQYFHGDINGGFTLRERTSATSRTVGAVETITTQVGRPSLNGDLEWVERREARIENREQSREEVVTVERRDANGNLQPALREQKQTQVTGGITIENATQYIVDPAGQLQWNSQSVMESQKRTDGSERKQITIYGRNAPGRPTDSERQLREQQILEKRTANGQTIESFSIRRPALDNPTNLGAVQKISERVCTGSCQ